MDYLLVDLIFVLFVSLKNIADVFQNGKVIGKIDVFVNLAGIYLLYKYFLWKFKLIQRIKKEKAQGRGEVEIADSSVASSLDYEDVELLKKEQAEILWFKKWIFAYEDFKYTEDDLDKVEKGDINSHVEEKQKLKSHNLASDKDLKNSLEEDNLEAIDKLDENKSTSKKGLWFILKSKFQDFTKKHQILFLDFTLVILVAVLVFLSKWSYVHIPLIIILLVIMDLAGLTNMLPGDYSKKLVRIPLLSILVIKFFLYFKFVAKKWIYHIIGHIGSLLFILYILMNLIYLLPSLKSFKERMKNMSSRKKLNQIGQESKKKGEESTTDIGQIKFGTGVSFNDLSTPQTAQITPDKEIRSQYIPKYQNAITKTKAFKFDIKEENEDSEEEEKREQSFGESFDNSRMNLKDESLFFDRPKVNSFKNRSKTKDFKENHSNSSLKRNLTASNLEFNRKMFVSNQGESIEKNSNGNTSPEQSIKFDSPISKRLKQDILYITPYHNDPKITSQ